MIFWPLLKLYLPPPWLVATFFWLVDWGRVELPGSVPTGGFPGRTSLSGDIACDAGFVPRPRAYTPLAQAPVVKNRRKLGKLYVSVILIFVMFAQR